VKLTTSTQNRNGDGPRPVSARRSGLQAAHGRVYQQMQIMLIAHAPAVLGPERVDEIAAYHAAQALSDRQRAELHARKQRRAA